MSIYLYKCDAHQQFTEVDEIIAINLLELTINHKEGRVANASLVLPSAEPIPFQGWAFVATDDRGYLEPILKGQFVGMPKMITDTTKLVELIATPANLVDQASDLMEEIQTKHKDCLFIDGSENYDLADYLEFGQELFCYDRITHQLKLSSIFKGNKHQVFSTQILKDSLQFRIMDTPLSGMHLTLSCEWIQEERGEINLMPCIESQFPQGRINTLSPKGLMMNWPQAGQVLGRSGYAVVASKLQEFLPKSTGVLGHYPMLTPLIHGKTYKNYWLQGKLNLEWTYCQKRREQIEVLIHHHNQYLGASRRPVRKLKLKVNPHKLNLKKQSRFFETDAGQKAILNGVNIAKSHLAYSARAAEIKFQVSFADALDLSLDHQLTIHHASLPTGTLSGKVVNYFLERRYDRAVASVTIAIATGVGEEFSTVLVLQDKDQSCDLFEVEQQTPDVFVESLSVHNHAQEQILWLQSQVEPVSRIPPELATRIDFKLKDLRSKDVIERKIQLHDLHWSAPNQLEII